MEKSFGIPASGGTKTIDPERPIQVKKKIKLATTTDTFTTIKAAKKAKTVFGSGVSITVGKGDQNAITRFGPGTDLSAEAIEAFITAARLAIGEDTADVEIGFGEFRCQTGREFEEFLSEVSGQIRVDPAEVVQ